MRKTFDQDIALFMRECFPLVEKMQEEIAKKKLPEFRANLEIALLIIKKKLNADKGNDTLRELQKFLLSLQNPELFTSLTLSNRVAILTGWYPTDIVQGYTHSDAWNRMRANLGWLLQRIMLDDNSLRDIDFTVYEHFNITRIITALLLSNIHLPLVSIKNIYLIPLVEPVNLALLIQHNERNLVTLGRNKEKIANQKLAFLLGSHPRVGAESDIFKHFYKGPMYHNALLTMVNSFMFSEGEEKKADSGALGARREPAAIKAIGKTASAAASPIDVDVKDENEFDSSAMAYQSIADFVGGEAQAEAVVNKTTTLAASRYRLGAASSAGSASAAAAAPRDKTPRP